MDLSTLPYCFLPYCYLSCIYYITILYITLSHICVHSIHVDMDMYLQVVMDMYMGVGMRIEICDQGCYYYRIDPFPFACHANFIKHMRVYYVWNIFVTP